MTMTTGMSMTMTMTMTMGRGRGRRRSRSRNLAEAGAGNFKNGQLQQPWYIGIHIFTNYLKNNSFSHRSGVEPDPKL